MRAMLPPDNPAMIAARTTTIACGRAHQELDALVPQSSGPRTGSIAATWVGVVLVVSASGDCATDLGNLLGAALLALPEVAT
jgi:hypothetical protein